jgi:hypothetical protein
MESILLVAIAAVIGSLIFTFTNKIGDGEKEKKRNAAIERAKYKFAHLSKDEKEVLNTEFTDEKILELFITDEMHKEGLV